MIADIETGKINMVVTKDLSRLGRNYIQTGYYTEEYFPSHGIRYIAVNDSFDTNNAENSDWQNKQYSYTVNINVKENN